MEKLGVPTNTSLEVPSNDVGASPTKIKSNYNFMRKIPKDAEASIILIGELADLEKSILAFIRLSDASCLGDLTEVPIQTRFLFILLGPQVTLSFSQIDRQTERQRERERETQKDRETERERQRERDPERQRETHKDRDRRTERQR